MTEELLHYLERAGGVINFAGVVVIVGGFLLAAVRYSTDYRRLGAEEAFTRFKVGLGHPLMLGLEILVVADVIETITVEPSFTSAATLGVLVLLRTFVSWTLALETEGRWPWQPEARE
ncbi:MAG: DUF1622 domain-containing protein [Planctomycetota bacterium]|nr:DUF1622 domain-containing protein [Planctomycetota bacterium]